jgi:hypothetical protein
MWREKMRVMVVENPTIPPPDFEYAWRSLVHTLWLEAGDMM